MKKVEMRFAHEPELEMYNHTKKTHLTRHQLIALTFCSPGQQVNIDEAKILETKKSLHELNPEFELEGVKYVLAEHREDPCWVRLSEPPGADRPSVIKLFHPVRRV